MEAEILLADAFAQLGVQARQALGASDQRIEMVIEPGGTRIQVRRRALVTDEVARRLLAETPSPSDSLLLVVGDRITDALNGSAGLEVATALLMEPTAGVAVREMARRLGRSASTVSEVLAALRGAGLVDDRHRIEGTELFWQVADRWPATRLHLAQLPMPGGNATTTMPLQLGLQDPQNTTGWALTDSAAAVAYGAPLAVPTGQLLDFYVPNRAIVRRATTLLGTAPSRSQARCAIRVAPVPAACTHRADIATNPFEWPLAHPVFVALDLAQDAGRGREILEAWTPPEGWARVW